MIILNSFINVSGGDHLEYKFSSNISDMILENVFREHYHNGIKFLKEVKHNSFITNNNIIVHAMIGGEYSDDRIINMPLEYVEEDVVYFKTHTSDVLCSQGIGLNLDSFTCDFYTFLKFTNLYTCLRLNNFKNSHWPLSDMIGTSRVIRELCAAYDIKFYYEDLPR